MISSRFTDERFTHQFRPRGRTSFREVEEKIDRSNNIGFFQSRRAIFKNRRELGKSQLDKLDRTGSAPKRQRRNLSALVAFMTSYSRTGRDASVQYITHAHITE